MKLTRLSTWKCAVLGTRELTFGAVTAVVGRSGSGKTTLLTTIDAAREWTAPLGLQRPSLARLVLPDASGAKITLELGFDPQEQGRFGLAPTADTEVLARALGEPVVDAPYELRHALSWFGEDGEQGLFDRIPEARGVALSYGTFDLTRYKTSASTDAEDRYAWVGGFLADVALEMGGAGKARADVVNGRFDRIATRLRLVGVRRAGKGGPYLPLFESGGGERLGLHQLSAGERQQAMFVGLLTALEPRRSVILIDALERDLDAQAQVGVLRLFLEGANQVVFATTSDVLRKASEVTTTIQLDAAPAR